MPLTLRDLPGRWGRCLGPIFILKTEKLSQKIAICGQRMGVGMRRCGFQSSKWGGLPGPRPVTCEMYNKIEQDQWLPDEFRMSASEPSQEWGGARKP